MSKKVTYKVKANEPSLFVVAINTTEDDYRLAWLLNSSLKINLARAEHLAPTSNQSFPTFFYMDDVGGISYTLAANKIEGMYLSPQLKNVDYLFKISGTLTESLKLELLSKIRLISEITACILIKTDSTPLLDFLNNF